MFRNLFFVTCALISLHMPASALRCFHGPVRGEEPVEQEPPPAPRPLVRLNAAESILFTQYCQGNELPSDFDTLTHPLQIALSAHFSQTDGMKQATRDVPMLSAHLVSGVQKHLLAGYVPAARKFVADLLDEFGNDLGCSAGSRQVTQEGVFHAEQILATGARGHLRRLLTKINARSRMLNEAPLFPSPIEAAANTVKDWFNNQSYGLTGQVNMAVEYPPSLVIILLRANETFYRLFFLERALTVRRHLAQTPAVIR